MGCAVKVAVVLACFSGFAMADERPVQLQKRQEEMRRLTEQNLAGTWALPGTFKMTDVCRFEQKDGKWVCTTNLPGSKTKRGAMRVKIEGIPGVSIVSMNYARDGERPETFTFSNTRFDDKDAVQITTQITFNYGALSIGRYAQMLDGYRNVTLSQGEMEWDEWNRPQAPVGAQLMVQCEDGKGETAGANVSLSGKDLLELRRQYPKAVDEHLRPVLRQLQLESLLAADPLMAWHVFGGEMRPDEAMLSRLGALLPALDSDDFKARLTAMDAIRGLGLPGAVAATHLDRSKLTDQQDVLLAAALGQHKPRGGVDVEACREDVGFLIDCLYCEDVRLREAALGKLRQKVGSAAVSFDVRAEFARRCDAIEELRERVR